MLSTIINNINDRFQKITVVREACIRAAAWWHGFQLGPYRDWLGRYDTADEQIGGGMVPAQVPQGLNRHGKPLWTATRLEVAEKLWGQEFLSPLNRRMLQDFLKPIGLNPAMSVLDLHAGVGGAARLMATDFGTWVTGLDPSPFLATEGMNRSRSLNLAQQAVLMPYIPEEFRGARRVDCIIVNELPFCLKNKVRFWDGLDRALKPRGQIHMVDFVIDSPSNTHPAIALWREREPIEPFPWTVEEIEKAFTERGLTITLSEDVSDVIKLCVQEAIQTLLSFVEERTVDMGTRQAVVDEVELWGTRVTAMEHGLRMHRILVTKKPSK